MPLFKHDSKTDFFSHIPKTGGKSNDMVIFRFPDFQNVKGLIDGNLKIKTNAKFPLNGSSKKRMVNIDAQTMGRIQDFYKEDFKFLNI